MIKRIWSTGEQYEQSKRENRNKNIYEEIKHLDNQDQPKEKVSEHELEQEIIDMREQTVLQFKDNRREEASKRMGEREMIMVGTLNPFVKSDYLKDLQNQEEFLKPQNSNFNEKKSL